MLPLSTAELNLAPERSLYRLGHSTLLMKLRGGWWLTDPVFSERASPFSFMGPKRFHAPPISIDELPPITGVLLSHDHYDHLDRAAVRALAAKTDLFICTLGVGDRLIGCAIVGVGLPQVNPRQEMLRRYYEEQSGCGFDDKGVLCGFFTGLGDMKVSCV